LGDSPAPAFEDALFTLGPGDVSEPVKTEFGYHLIKLMALREGGEQEFSEVRDTLVLNLREEAAAELYTDQVDELDERALESLNGLAEVAEALDLELQTVADFNRAGGLPLGANSDLIAAVFSLEVLEDSENSPVIDLGDGRAVVVRVSEYREAEVRPLAEVQAAIEAQLTSEQAISLMTAGAGAVVDSLNAGTDRTAVELPASANWQVAVGLRRGDQELPVDLSAAVFRSAKPEATAATGYQGLLLASGDFAIYRVTGVRAGSPDLYSLEDRDVRKNQLAGRLGGGQATALVEALVAVANVRVTDNILGLDGEL
jgi:peptidyl-prolyl cis-trans isomerase D